MSWGILLVAIVPQVKPALPTLKRFVSGGYDLTQTTIRLALWCCVITPFRTEADRIAKRALFCNSSS